MKCDIIVRYDYPNVIEAKQMKKTSGPWFHINMPSHQYRKSHCGDKTVIWSSYLHNGISYTGKMASLYWFSPHVLDLI